MTLQQLLTFTAAYEPSDVRRAMVAVLAGQRPRRAEEYRRFYVAVCLHLMSGRHRTAKAVRHIDAWERRLHASASTSRAASNGPRAAADSTSANPMAMPSSSRPPTGAAGPPAI